MKRFVKSSLRAAVLALIAGASTIGFQSAAFADDMLTIGSKAPQLDIEHWVQNGEGKFKEVKKFEKGKVYLVEFWATWCGPCKASMPHLAETQTKYADKGVQIISISDEPLDVVEEFLETDFPGEEGKTFKDLTKAYCLTTDPDKSANNDYMVAAGQNGIPCAFLVGKDGVIEWIGHPMEMDEPLSQVVEGKWDREKFATTFKEQQEEQALQMKVMQKLGRLVQRKKFDEALEGLDEFLADAKKPSAKLMLTQIKLQLQTMASRPGKEIGETLGSILEMEIDNPMQVNQFAWMTYELFDEEAIDDKEILKKALAAAQKAATKLEGETKGATLDTVSHLQYALGDLKAALETQREAAKLVTSPQMDSVKEFLEQLEEEAKTPKKKK